MKIFIYGVIGLALSAQTACSQSGGDSQGSTETTISKDVVSENLNLDAFHEKLASTEGNLVDVRTPDEFAGGHIPGALNINFLDDAFISKMETTVDKNMPLFIYCASGNRSGKATTALKKAGYTEVYNLTGAGFAQWAAKGWPVE